MNPWIKKLAILLMIGLATFASLATSVCDWISAEKTYSEPRFHLLEGELKKSFQINILLDTDPPDTIEQFKGTIDLTGAALWSPDPNYPNPAQVEILLRLDNAPDEPIVYQEVIELPTDLLRINWQVPALEIPFCQDFPCQRLLQIEFTRIDPNPIKNMVLEWNLTVQLGEFSGCVDDSAISIEVN